MNSSATYELRRAELKAACGAMRFEIAPAERLIDMALWFAQHGWRARNVRPDAEWMPPGYTWPIEYWWDRFEPIEDEQ